jgi:predicted aspartyl protease
MGRNVGIALGFMFWFLGESSGQSQGRLVRRLLTIPVEVNNTVGMFLVDTGSDCTIIDSAFAQGLGLKSSGTASVERNYSIGEHTTTIAERVRIGPKKWSAVPLVMLDLSMLSRIQMTPISGILGTDLIETMPMRLSYSSGIAEVIDDVEKKGFRVALDKVRNRYFVPVTIGTTTLEMLLDSGTNMTAMSSSGWQLLPLSSKVNRTIEGIQSSGGPAAALIACIPSIQVGDTVLRDHPIRAALRMRPLPASLAAIFWNALS